MRALCAGGVTVAWVRRAALVWLGVLVSLLLGCAGQPAAPASAPPQLLHDEWFAASHEPIDAERVFALSDAMRRYADSDLAPVAYGRDSDVRRALMEALYTRGKLKLHYDASLTRTAAEAFEARAGNCLSLVIMTAAFARHFGLDVAFQSVQSEPVYTRAGDLVFANGHVNLVLSQPLGRRISSGRLADELTVDFLPPSELGRQIVQPLLDRTVVAMYFNNRGAEALAEGRIDAAYAWVREALRQDITYRSAANTLAVIYLRSGHPDAAETALRYMLVEEPNNVSALGNLVTALRREGLDEAASQVAARLTRLQPEAPFLNFDLGRQAMASGDYLRAHELFARELQRQPEQPEVHFWAALADWHLGHKADAAQHLERAYDYSSSAPTKALYGAKLAHLRALQLQ